MKHAKQVGVCICVAAAQVQAACRALAAGVPCCPASQQHGLWQCLVLLAAADAALQKSLLLVLLLLCLCATYDMRARVWRVSRAATHLCQPTCNCGSAAMVASRQLLCWHTGLCASVRCCSEARLLSSSAAEGCAMALLCSASMRSAGSACRAAVLLMLLQPTFRLASGEKTQHQPGRATAEKTHNYLTGTATWYTTYAL